MSNLIQLEGQEIRQVEYNGETYYAIVDIVATLTKSNDPAQYLKQLDKQLKIYIGTNCTPVVMTTKTGEQIKIIAGNRETVFRIIQAIPSPYTEPFKRWLAQAGEQALQEIEDPTKVMDRVGQSFGDLGYPNDIREEELIFTQLAKLQERKEATNSDAKNGEIAARAARKAFEEQTGQKMNNFKDHIL